MAGMNGQMPSHASEAPTATRGNQPLEPKIVDGVKVFELTASAVQWEVTPGEFVDAYAYNGMVPGPLLRVTEGDTIRIVLKFVFNASMNFCTNPILLNCRSCESCMSNCRLR